VLLINLTIPNPSSYIPRLFKLEPLVKFEFSNNISKSYEYYKLITN
jgi:hypothetical protein